MALEPQPGRDSTKEPKLKRYKSGPSNMYSFVRFYNRTSRYVDVVWLNYEGIGVKYVTLKPRQFVDINTYVGHPWIFRDSQTGDKMVVQLKEVYEPEEFKPHPEARRNVVSITIPVYSLKERCLREVRNLVERSDISSLEIPETLIQKLLEMDNTLAHYRHNFEPSGRNGENNDDLDVIG